MPNDETLRATTEGTASSDVAPPPKLPYATGSSPTLSELTERAGFLNNRAQILHSDTDDLHLDVIMQEWQSKSTDLVRQDMPTLLGQLADLGFAWRDIARLIGVSVPAVQKWRRGNAATGQSRFHAAAVLAACALIADHYLVKDIASWFEAPVVFGYPITALDLYAAKKPQLVFRLATGKADPEQVLSAFDPDWRETYRSDFEVFESEDGGLAIRAKER
jgi:transcriptional regulator with XRE-family HTH domain